MLSRLLSWPFFRYVLVGGIGFVLDAGGLELFIFLGVPVYIARGISMIISMISTYILHRSFSFKDAACPSRQIRQVALFLGCQGGAAAVWGMLTFVSFTPAFLNRMLALVAGVSVGLFMNYVLLRMFVFPVEKKHVIRRDG